MVTSLSCTARGPDLQPVHSKWTCRAPFSGKNTAQRRLQTSALHISRGAAALLCDRRVGRDCRGTCARRDANVVKAEISYIMVKPDGVQRGLVGEIIGRLERKGFKLKGLKLFTPPRSLAEEHYKDLSSKPFFKDLVDYIISGPVVAMVWEGTGVVKSARKLIGATNPLEAEPGTIRGDFAVQTGRNVVHGSDSPENGERETALWFASGEGLADWTPTMLPWLRE